MSQNSTSAGTINNVIRTQNYKRVFLQLESAKSQLDQAIREAQAAKEQAEKAQAKADAYDLVNDPEKGGALNIRTQIQGANVKANVAPAQGESAKFVNGLAGHPDEIEAVVKEVTVGNKNENKYDITLVLGAPVEIQCGEEKRAASEIKLEQKTLTFDAPEDGNIDTIECGSAISGITAAAPWVKYQGEDALSLGPVTEESKNVILKVAVDSGNIVLSLRDGSVVVCEPIPEVFNASQ